MELKLTNILLANYANFINSLTLDTAQANIARVRIRKILVDKYNEYQEDRLEFVSQYAKLDEQGNPVLLEDGKTYNIPEDKQAEAIKTLTELDQTEAVIDLTEYVGQAHKLQTALENYNRDLTGDQAQLLVAFLDGISDTEKDGTK